MPKMKKKGLVKKIDDDIGESEERYRNLFELAPDGIISVDLKGFVKSCNITFVKMTGFSKDDIIGKHFSRLPTVRKKDIPKYIKLVASIIGREMPEPFEFEWIRKDGSVRWGEIHVGLTKIGGKLTGMQAFIRDITEKKKAEVELNKSRKELEVRVRDLERFSKLSVSRELKMVELKNRIKELEEKLKKHGIETGKGGNDIKGCERDV